MQRVFGDRRSSPRVCLCVLMLMVSACGGGGGNPAAPAPVPSSSPGPTPPPAPVPLLTEFTIGAAQPEMPGQNTGGRIALSVAAPGGGFPVTLTASNNQAISVPVTVTVPAGATEVAVPILTHEVMAPVTVTVLATAGGVTLPATLSLSPGTFLSFAGTSGSIVGARSRRLSGPDTIFSATVSTDLNSISLGGGTRSSSFWSLRFFAPSGEELRRGTYVGSVGSSPGPSPVMALTITASSGSLPSCFMPVGASFVIHDVVYGPGPRLERLDASFVQQCSGGTVIGELLIAP